MLEERHAVVGWMEDALACRSTPFPTLPVRDALWTKVQRRPEAARLGRGWNGAHHSHVAANRGLEVERSQIQRAEAVLDTPTAREAGSHQSPNMSELGCCPALCGKGHHIGIETRNWMSVEPEHVIEFPRSAVHTANGLAPDCIISCGLFLLVHRSFFINLQNGNDTAKPSNARRISCGAERRPPNAEVRPTVTAGVIRTPTPPLEKGQRLRPPILVAERAPRSFLRAP